MNGKSPDPSQLSLLPQRLEDLVNPRPPLCSRGYRGKRIVDGTRIEIPKKPLKRTSAYKKRKDRKRFRRRAGIEPIIGHLKSDFRLLRNEVVPKIRTMC